MGIVRLDAREAMPPGLRGAIVALGNFDGFHLGHQAVVGEALAWAKAEGRPALVATFDPHPVHFFAPQAAPFRLTTLDQRLELFGAAGADAMLVFHFDARLAATTAEHFVELLGRRLGVAGVVTGEDFTFGKGRTGNVDVLKTLGAEHGLSARAVGPVSERGEVVSSSRIREALQAGDCATATQLLTRPFAVEGIVQHGDKNGRELGYPTANVDMGTYLRPRYGIYAVRGRLADGRILEQPFQAKVTDTGQRHPVTRALPGSETNPPQWGEWLRQISADVRTGSAVMSGADDKHVPSPATLRNVPDEERAEALLRHSPAFAELLPLLPVARREALLLEILRGDCTPLHKHPVLELLRKAEHAWSAELARALLRALYRHMRKWRDSYDYQLRGALTDEFARRMPPALLGEIAAGLPDEPDVRERWQGVIDKLLITMQFRHDMLRALALR
mgnify:CR=1 FL=1